MTAPPHDTPPTVSLLPDAASGADAPGAEVAGAGGVRGDDVAGVSSARPVVVGVHGSPIEVLKVSARSHPTAVAGAIAGVIRGRGVAEIHVVGAGALNQAIKAVAVARGFVAGAGLDLVCTPSFADVEIDGEHRTAIRLTVDDRDHRLPDPAFTPAPYVVHS
jgi:stage V sporulation protein S